MQITKVSFCVVASLLSVVTFIELETAFALGLEPPLPVCQQESLEYSTSSQLLTQWIDKVQQRFQTTSSFKANFTQWAYLDALDTSEASSGVLRFLKPGRMRWEYAEPEVQDFVLKGSEVIFYQPRDNQALVRRVEDVLLSDLPLAFILGAGKLQESFHGEAVCRFNDSAQNYWVLELTPSKSSGDKSIRRLAMLLDEKGGIFGALVVDLNNNKTYVNFKDVVINPSEITEKTFELELPKGVDILRDGVD